MLTGSREGGNPFRAVLVILAVLACVAVNAAEPSRPEFAVDQLPIVRVGVVVDGDLEADAEALRPGLYRETLLGLKQEILTLTRREFDLRFPPEKLLQGRWSRERIRSAVDTLLQDPDVDIVLTMGVYSTHEICTRRDLPKPVIAPFVIDVELQGLPLEGEASGVRNLSYITTSGDIVRDLRRFHELVGFSTVHVLHDPLAVEVIPNIYDFVREKADEMGFEAVPAPVVGGADEAIAALPPETEAVYLVPLARMPMTEYADLLERLKQRKLPTFHILGKSEVERGVLAGVAPETGLTRFVRRIALHMHRILLGEEPGSLPVFLDRTERLTINMETARAIDWYPNWRVAVEAELINEEEVAGTETSLSLFQAVERVIEANLDLKAVHRSVAAGEEEIRRARSFLLPRVDATTLGRQIDDDRAAAALGSQPETAWTGSLAFRQLIYFDGALADVTVQRGLQAAREFDLETVRLDIALESAKAFLHLLRAQTLERIERSNLRLTESHLDLARRRQRLGVTGPAEVYRWESELATGRSNVLAATAAINAARAALNRLMHAPQEEIFVVEEPEMDDPILVVGDPRLRPHIDNRRSYSRFREFLVRDGLERSPELRAVAAGIDAQERALGAARRSFWAPTVALEGEVTRLFSEGGEGTEGLDLDPSGTLPFAAPAFPEADDTSWSIGVSVGLPLFTGGARRAEVRRALETLAELRHERDSLAEKVEQRIRNALFRAAFSYPSIELHREAAGAARKNLDLVTEQYAQGLISVIELLDAQNAALVSDQSSANAVFDFLFDLMEVQRSTATFDFFITPEERDDWFRRLEEFVQDLESRADPDRR